MTEPIYRCGHILYMDAKCPWCEIERLKAHMRNVAGWLNNGCEPAKGAAELLVVAGLPPPQSEKQP